MSKLLAKKNPMNKNKDVGTLGDDKASPNEVLSHDQIKKRCSRFLTKLMINKSPKELGDYFFELVYFASKYKGDKRLDLVITEFDEKYSSGKLEEEQD